MFYPTLSSSVIFRMLLFIVAESSYVSFKILTGKEIAWTESEITVMVGY